MHGATERVDFYVLNSTAVKQRWIFACRLAEKAYLRDLTVVLANATAAEAAELDELLWTFNEGSFVPHQLHHTGPPGAPAAGTAVRAAPVQLTADLAAVEAADLLVNLGDTLPTGLHRFTRIAEVIDADAERRRLGRERFKAYRELMVPVETHRLDDA